MSDQTPDEPASLVAPYGSEILPTWEFVNQLRAELADYRAELGEANNKIHELKGAGELVIADLEAARKSAVAWKERAEMISQHAKGQS